MSLSSDQCLGKSQRAITVLYSWIDMLCLASLVFNCFAAAAVHSNPITFVILFQRLSPPEIRSSTKVWYAFQEYFFEYLLV